jgi:glutamate synthase domain-containing protein 2
MTPVVRLYWAIALVLLPLTATWLAVSVSGEPGWGSVLARPLQLSLFLVALIWTLVGGFELFFCVSNLRRNYPVLANIRYLLEFIRPEIQQYFIANNTEERPFSRERRNLIYRRAKGANDTLPFGTQQDILAEGYRSLAHSMHATEVDKRAERVMFGGPACKQPYSASRLNISAMSFGSLSGPAIEALNKGAAAGNFAHNTGEGSLSDHHRKHGGDIIWQIGTGYFGCRHSDGRFNDEAFAERSNLDQVKMIELKLSQGAKPAHGGVLPGAKVTEEIARIRLVEGGKTVYSPANHPEFDNPLGLLQFVDRLRKLSGGKPVGFKFCLGRRVEFMAVVKAMLESGIKPDFITVDGAEGGTGAAPVEFSNRLGTPCLEATYYVHQVLKGAGIRNDMKIIASGQTATAFDMLEKIAVGANAVNAARSMMMALGCIQSLSCNTNHCPTGIATQDPARAKAIDIDEKAQRVHNFHRSTLNCFLELCGAMGCDDPDKLGPQDLFVRCEEYLKNYDEIFSPLDHGQLLGDTAPDSYRLDWMRARPDAYV